MKKLLISACLLGEACRYDGKSKPDFNVQQLAQKYELIPVCPEVLGGLPIPREPSEIVGNRVIMVNGNDVTVEYKKGAERTLDICTQNGCRIAILKSRSPSCGKGYVYDGTYTKTLTVGNGITTELLLKNGITVLNETEIEKLDL